MTNTNERHALQEVSRVEERIIIHISEAESAARMTVENARRKAAHIIEEAHTLPIECNDAPLEKTSLSTITAQSLESIPRLDPLIDQLVANAIYQLLGVSPDEKGTTP